ncbi:Enterobactin exporter EntS [Alphaproteobacteria bacterium SO-S41]|nr:Enterobactin exporter EntS [Alphaproteobacteria bacterium SO-S41]
MAFLPAAAVLRHRDFRLLWFARVASVLAMQMQAVAIAWIVYDRARQTMGVGESAFLIGMIGLVQFVPILVLSLFAGQAADRFDRKTIIRASMSLEGISALILTWIAIDSTAPMWVIFVVAALFGASRSFMGPAQASLQPTLVPRAELPNAIAWGSLAWQGSSIAGPAVGGYLYAAAPWVPFASAGLLFLIAIILVTFIRPPERLAIPTGRSLKLIGEGLVYVFRNKVVLGAISLDLFAVLLGGATALLPVYARDVLHIGPDGLGHLRAAPAIGAVAVAIWLATWPMRRHTGTWMFGGVVLFGIATIVFGLSENFWLSMAALILLGGGDMLSVYVRSSLIQLSTPDEMRGRVSAASSIFISASNELGEFRAGSMGALVGAVPSVVAGGVAALGIAALWAYWFPALRKADRLE